LDRAVTSSAVGLAGDWHGDTAWALSSITRLASARVRTVFHLGDFGLWPGNSGRKYLQKVDRACRSLGVNIYVTPGNHEWWPKILSTPLTNRDEIGSVAWVAEHVAFLPRGHRWSIQGRTFVSLGGAPSVDFEWRTRGQDFWPEEMMTPEDVRRIEAGGHAEVMLAHDAPDAPFQTPAVRDLVRYNPQGWSDLALTYAAVGRRRMTTAFLAVAPRLFVHGHYHVADAARVELPGQSYGCEVVSLAANGDAQNLLTLEVKDLRIVQDW
jgi:hypothetical protein